MVAGRSSEMRGAATVLVTVVLALVAAGAAGAQGPNVYQTTLEEANQKTPEVSTDELKRILANGSAVVLDTRPHLEYAMSHIPGRETSRRRPVSRCRCTSRTWPRFSGSSAATRPGR